ncbi:MAG: PA14 domain-containing protein [Verrucomicrobiales bacterium]
MRMPTHQRRGAFAGLAVAAIAALWPPLVGALELEAVAVAGQPAPGVADAVFADFDSPVLNAAGDLAFRASLGGGTASAFGGFFVRKVSASQTPGTLAVANLILADPSRQVSTAIDTPAWINYHDTGDNGEFGNDLPFPGGAIGSGETGFVVEATGTVTFPHAGVWSIGVLSDDGFSLEIGQGRLIYNSGRAAAETIGHFTVAAWDYPIRLVYFQASQGATVELWAKPGTWNTYDSGFRLVGDSAGGGLSVKATTSSVNVANSQGIWRMRSGLALEKVARTGDPAPVFNGAGKVFGSLREPMLDGSGNVAFLGDLAIDNDLVHIWDNQGLWTTGSASGELWLMARENHRASINRDGSLIPWGNDPPLFDSFSSAAVTASGSVSFTGTLKSYPSDLYNGEAGSWSMPRPPAQTSGGEWPQIVAWTGEVAPGATSQYAKFSPAVAAGGAAVAFLGRHGGGDPLESEGAWTGLLPAAPSLLAGNGTSAPGGAGPTFDLAGLAGTREGHLAWWAGVNDPLRSEGAFTRKAGISAALALAGDAAPGAAALRFESFYDPAINERGQVAFRASLRESSGAIPANDHGIWTGGAASHLRLVVRAA